MQRDCPQMLLRLPQSSHTLSHVQMEPSLIERSCLKECRDLSLVWWYAMRNLSFGRLHLSPTLPRQARCTIKTDPNEVSMLRTYIKYNKRDKCIFVVYFLRPPLWWVGSLHLFFLKQLYKTLSRELFNPIYLWLHLCFHRNYFWNRWFRVPALGVVKIK